MTSPRQTGVMFRGASGLLLERDHLYGPFFRSKMFLVIAGIAIRIADACASCASRLNHARAVHRAEAGRAPRYAMASGFSDFRDANCNQGGRDVARRAHCPCAEKRGECLRRFARATVARLRHRSAWSGRTNNFSLSTRGRPGGKRATRVSCGTTRVSCGSSRSKGRGYRPPGGLADAGRCALRCIG